MTPRPLNRLARVNSNKDALFQLQEVDTEIDSVHASPRPGVPNSGTGPWPVGNQAAQRQVSGGQVSGAPSVPAAAPQRLSPASDPQALDSHRTTGPWALKGWGPLS